jgi:hypothetical protein
MRLLSTALLAAALSLSFTGIAHAQYELAWDKCPGSFGAITNKRFDCTADASAQPIQLVVAFSPPKTLQRFAGVRVDIELSSATGNLPDWWKVGIGECRDGAVATSLSPGLALGQCQNPWTGSKTGGGAFWASGFGGAGRTLLSFAYAREEKTSLTAGTRYLAAVISIDGSANSSSCSGCAAEVCIAITRFQIAQAKDEVNNKTQDPGPDDEINLSRSTGISVVSMNARSGDNPCGSTVRNRTWGQVKSTYR